VSGGRIRVAHVMHGLMMGGLEQMVMYLCEAGRPLGVEPLVISFGADGPMRALLASHRIPLVALGSVRGLAPTTVRKIAQALRDHAVDIVHAHDMGPWLNCVAARALRPGARVLATFHQTFVPKGIWRGAMLAAAALTDAVVACGNEVHASIERWRPRTLRLELIGNGIPLGPEPSPSQRAEARRRLGLPEDAVIIGYVGRLHREKGVDLLIDGFAEAFADRPNVHLVLVGKGIHETAFRAQAAETRNPCIHFLGEIVNATSLLPGFDVYAQPSRREGRSLSMLEAMAAALPTVAQGLPAIREIHVEGESALLLEPTERPRFAHALRRLADDASLRARMGASARLLARNFSVGTMVQAYARLYRSLPLPRAVPLTGTWGASP
jgi:glycosyltransferase involved in cell wall biosynthesis